MPDGTLNHLRFAADGSIVLQRDVTKPEDNSEAKTSIRIDGSSGDLEIKAGDDVLLEMKSAKITWKGDMEITRRHADHGEREDEGRSGSLEQRRQDDDQRQLDSRGRDGGSGAKGTLDLSGMLSLKASGGKVKAGGLEVLVEQASGTAAAPVLLPPPPASPGDGVRWR